MRIGELIVAIRAHFDGCGQRADDASIGEPAVRKAWLSDLLGNPTFVTPGVGAVKRKIALSGAGAHVAVAI